MTKAAAHPNRRDALKRQKARQLRDTSSEAERKMWGRLRSKRMVGLRFRRQQPIGPYIVDFYCSAAKLIVELDGRQHAEEANILHDEVRTRWLEQQGFRVMRIWNTQFMRDPDGVLDGILNVIRQSGIPLPENRAPSPKRARQPSP